ncbi:MAG: NBR1-Ig-like domain-containing protein [Chloroflexota bacterium]
MLIKKILKQALPFVLLLGLLLLSACSRSEAAPTTDPALIFTQAAETVAAGLTQTAASLPTATPTLTLPPTNTPEPTQAVSPTSAVSPTPTLPPTATRPSVADRADFVTQSPLDGTVMYPEQPFTLTWTVKNSGTTTWTTAYQVRYFLSDPALRFGASDIRFPKEVKPNENVDLVLSMKAPAKAGDYRTIWVLTNADGQNFFTLTLDIKVSGSAPSPTQTAAPATDTPPPAPTETETPSPTP